MLLTKSVFKVLITALGWLIALTLVIFLGCGCKSFKPVTVEGYPDECNLYLTTLNYYSVNDKGDSAFVGTVYEDCKKAREAMRAMEREKHCKQLIYSDAELDKSNYQKYTQYLECCNKK